MAGAGAAAAAAAQLRADLQLLDASTREAAGLLDVASRQLGDLDRQAAPMTVRTRALARAKQNILAAKQRSEEVLEHLDTSRKVQGIVQAGPREDMEVFLAALARLEAALDFLQAQRSMQSAEDALRHTSAMRDSALAACGQEFAALLHKHSAVPIALVACLRAGDTGTSSGAQRSRAAAAAAAPSVSTAGSAAAGSASPHSVTAVPVELLPEAVLPKLRALAAAMLRSGSSSGAAPSGSAAAAAATSPSGRACVAAYVEARRGVMHKCLEGLLSPFAGAGREEMARLSWQQMEARIPGWASAVRLFVRLVQEEARLCSAIFPAPYQAAVLSQVAVSGSSSLTECAEAMLGARRVPDKLFSVLDMHDVVDAALIPLRAVLRGVGASRLERASAGAGPVAAAEQVPILSQLSQLRSRLAAEVRACFNELQDSLARDAPKAGSSSSAGAGGGAPPDGTVHPLCASTVAQLRRVAGYESALPVLFGEAAASSAAAQSGGGGCRGRGLAEEARLQERMAAAVTRIFDTLLAALDACSKVAYKNRALAALHQMNNVHYIVQAVEGSRELKAVSEGWVESNKAKVDAYRQQYVELAWGPMLSVLRQDGRQPVPANLAGDKAARQAIKDRWSAINKVITEARPQQGWAVPDAALRDKVKDGLSSALQQPYEAFYVKYKHATYTDNHSKYERYSPADLATLLHELFERADVGGPSLVGRSSASYSGGALLGRRLSSTMRRMTSSSMSTL